MGKQEAKVIGAVLGIVLVIIVVMLLLPSGETVDPNHNNTTKPGENTSGQWSIGEKREEEPQGQGGQSDIPKSIRFLGTDSYTVSSSKPDIELTNPEVNTGVNFVFTITDRDSGEIIAKTDMVAPGKYVYVNIFDHYKQVGKYNVTIGTSTFSSTGQQLNGINSKVVIEVVND